MAIVAYKPVEEEVKNNIELLESMDTVVCMMDDEFAMIKWRYFVSNSPDESNLESIASIASSPKYMHFVCELFRETVDYYGKSGWVTYRGEEYIGNAYGEHQPKMESKVVE